MSDITARLDLPLIQPSQAQKHVTHNEALQVLDGLVQAALEETGATTPPFEPVNGTLYATGANPTDDWAGEPNKLALRITDAWLFITPQEGWRAWDKSTGQFKVFNGTAWAQILPDLNNLDGLGIGTSSDATNRLAVAATASLFTHAGIGHQVKVNKSTPADTASLLFQSGFTGHAEMGLAGDTAFSIKLSDDGTTWHTALYADPTAQQLETDFKVTGNAVQQSPADVTTGHLMRADYGYGPGNLLGPVSESGGTPTGAVMEHGSNANGTYLCLADGTAICWHRVLIKPAADAASGIKSVAWTLPITIASNASNTAITNIVDSTNPSARGGATVRLLSSTSVDLRYYEGVGTASDVYSFATVIGRWFN